LYLISPQHELMSLSIDHYCSCKKTSVILYIIQLKNICYLLSTF
jgi:hypothetical protein